MAEPRMPTTVRSPVDRGEFRFVAADATRRWRVRRASYGGPTVRPIEGRGVPASPSHSYAWYHLAAENGQLEARALRDALGKSMTRGQLADAQLSLGVKYAYGEGVSNDDAAAAD